jgi:hypothetical protein
MTPLPERQPPTHILRIEVPLFLGDRAADRLDYDPVKQALHIALSASRAAYDGVICDTVDVTMVDTNRAFG